MGCTGTTNASEMSISKMLSKEILPFMGVELLDPSDDGKTALGGFYLSLS